MRSTRRAAIALACAAGALGVANRTFGIVSDRSKRSLLPPPDGAMNVGWIQRLVPGNANPCLIFYPSALKGDRLPTSPPPPPEGHSTNLERRFGTTAASALIHGKGYAIPRAVAGNMRFPVVLFAPGLRLAAFDYRSILESVASHGYVVVALTLPTGTDYDAAAAHLRIVTDSLLVWSISKDDALGALCEIGSIGILGHSLGGAAALLAAHRDKRIRAAANLDGDYGGGTSDAKPDQPLLYAVSVDPMEPAHSLERRRQVWSSVSGRSRSATVVRLSTFRHLDFLDAALAKELIPVDRRQGRFGPIDGMRSVIIARSLASGFFDEHLKGRSGFVDRLMGVPEAQIAQRP